LHGGEGRGALNSSTLHQEGEGGGEVRFGESHRRWFLLVCRKAAKEGEDRVFSSCFCGGGKKGGTRLGITEKKGENGMLIAVVIAEKKGSSYSCFAIDKGKKKMGLG